MIYITFLALLAFSPLAKGDCIFDLSRPFAPFILDENHAFPVAVNFSQVQFKESQYFHVQCPAGTSNVFLNDTGDTGICLDNSMFINDRTNEELDFLALVCKPLTYPLVKLKSEEKCANNYALYEVGVYLLDEFSTLYSVCFDELKKQPFYASFKNVEFNCTDRFCRLVNLPFSNYEEVFEVDLDMIYLQSDSILSELLDKPYTLKYQPVQLVKNYYFLDTIHQETTFDYINTIPLDANAAEVNHDCSSYITKTTPIVYAGTLNVKTELNSIGEEIEVTFDGETIPSPKWLWCVSYAETGGAVNGSFHLIHMIKEDPTNVWADICSSGAPILDEEDGFYKAECLFADTVNVKLHNFLKATWPNTFL